MAIPMEILVTVGTAAVAIIGAAAYSIISGRRSSVDLDDDGNDEVTFGGESTDSAVSGDSTDSPRGGDESMDLSKHSNVVTEDDPAHPTNGERIETEPSPHNGPEVVEDTEEDPTTEINTVEPPTSVQEIGENLASIRGIGPNRADTFREAGFETATDLWFASDRSIIDVHGIGDRALTQIRSDIGSFDDDSE